MSKADFSTAHGITRSQVRRLDYLAINEAGIPGIVLMENAAIRFVDALIAAFGAPQRQRYVVVCGAGNNGGDGFAIARHLANRGGRVTILCAKRLNDISANDDAGINAMIVRRMKLPIKEIVSINPRALATIIARADVLIDALFGTGLTRPVTGDMAAIIRAMNKGRRIAAVDVPSGLDCDTGMPLGVAVEADLTVTFAACKRGFKFPHSRRFTGRVVVADISIPHKFY